MSLKGIVSTAAGLSIIAGAAHAADRAGRVTAAQPQAFQAEGVVGHVVKTGSEIFQQARVYTKQYGTMEIMLEDGSQLTVAPNSSIVIDEYVFAGERRPGALGISLARGAMRMVSGRMPKDGITVKTPVATIGVRGTAFWVNAASPELIELWVTEGAVAAAPSATDTVFEFTAPAYATCTASDCQAAAPPPTPAINPLGGGNGGDGDPGVDSRGSEAPEPESGSEY